MFKLIFAFSVLLLLVGCARTLEEEAITQARIAIEAGNYTRGSVILLAGCDDLHAQSLYLIHMWDHRNENDLMGMVNAWIAIGNIDAPQDFITEEAYRLLNTTFANTIILE